MARKSNQQKEEERRALLTPDERAAEDAKTPKVEVPASTIKKDDSIIPGESKVIPAKEDVVEIKRSDLDKMMKIMESQGKDISLLLRTADKSKIAKELNKEGENLIKQCKVSTWDDTGKFIIGWKLITNRCEVVMGKWFEEQTVTIMFDGGEVMTVPLLEFYRKTLKKVEADIISRTNEYDDKKNPVIIFKLQFPTGKILLVNSVFVN